MSSPLKTLIQNAHIVYPDQIELGSLVIEGRKIVDINPVDHPHCDQTIEAEGRHLLPGVIDDQVHFREPGLTHKEDLLHATRACAKGGVTSFLEMPNTDPTTTSVDALEAKLKLASQKCLVNYGFYMGATSDNLEQLQAAQRTPGIKIFIGSSTGDLLVDQQEALERIFAETTLPICAHCEDESTIRLNSQKYAERTDVATHSLIRNHAAARIATQRAIDLATRHAHRFHVLHVSTADEIPLIKAASGLVTAEVCPHHLFFDITDYDRLGALVKMNPSIKTRDDCQALWQALLADEIQVVATDHAPHTLEEKSQPYPACPSGLPAVENSLALMLNQVNQNRCTINQVVRWMCENPALVWDIVDKGRIQVGYDADLVLVDMELSQKIENQHQVTKCGWSPWHGTSLQGWPTRTWVMGREVFRLEDDGGYWFAPEPQGSEIHFEHQRGGFYRP